MTSNDDDVGFDNDMELGRSSASESSASDSSSDSEESESSEEPDDSADSDYVPCSSAARATAATKTTSTKTATLKTPVTKTARTKTAATNTAATVTAATKPATAKTAAAKPSTTKTTRTAAPKTATKKPAVKKKNAANVEIRPFRIGITNLQHNFGWTCSIPSVQQKKFQPRLPPKTHAFLETDSPGYIFMSFFKPGLNIWLKGTNENGRSLLGDQWVDIDEAEGHRFLAVLLTCNVYRTSSWRAYWENDSLVDFAFIKQQMTGKRFEQVLRASRLYVASEAAASGASNKKSPAYDEKHKIRPMMNAVLKEFRRKRAASEYLSLDEQMVLCKARCRFITKMPNKPIGEGLKFFVLAEAESAYIHYADLASTKAEFEDEPFGRIFGLVIDILKGGDLKDGITHLDQGFTIVTDNYYTRVELANSLLSRDTYMIGVVKTNIPFAPDDLFKSRNHKAVPLKPLKRGGCRFRFTKDGKMTYVMWQDNRVVLVLSTEPNIGVAMSSVRRKDKSKGNKKKALTVSIPVATQTYIRYMRGVDVADQKIADQLQHHRSLRWYMQVFYQMIDMTILNTGAILRERPNGKRIWSSRKIKISVARFLAQMGRCSMPQTIVCRMPNMRDAFSIMEKRLNPCLRHIPTKMQRNVNGVVKTVSLHCVAHRQGVRTIYCCSCCNVPLHIGPYPCWEKFHNSRLYLFDDPDSNAATRNSVNRY